LSAKAAVRAHDLVLAIDKLIIYCLRALRARCPQQPVFATFERLRRRRLVALYHLGEEIVMAGHPRGVREKEMPLEGVLVSFPERWMTSRAS